MRQRNVRLRGVADTSPKPKKRINLALQGGGAHGAFGWGILDKFLEDGRVDIEGLSGTSAGSMNAVVYAYGKLKGNDSARQTLHDFWKGDLGCRAAVCAAENALGAPVRASQPGGQPDAGADEVPDEPVLARTRSTR